MTISVGLNIEWPAGEFEGSVASLVQSRTTFHPFPTADETSASHGGRRFRLPLLLFDTDETMQMVIGYRWQPLACSHRADTCTIGSPSLIGSRRAAEDETISGYVGMSCLTSATCYS
jgi:hypothetical protein